MRKHWNNNLPTETTLEKPWEWGCHVNCPFPSSGLPLCQNESKCETILIKVCFTYKFIFMQIKLIFIWKNLHEDSFWGRGKPELGNGLLIFYIRGKGYVFFSSKWSLASQLYTSIWQNTLTIRRYLFIHRGAKRYCTGRVKCNCQYTAQWPRRLVRNILVISLLFS